MKANENMLNMPPNFYCESCDYECSKKSLWVQHTLTSKHSKANYKLIKANKEYFCEKCSVELKHHSSFCRHKKKCQKNVENIINEDKVIDKDELIIMLIKQNTELIKDTCDFKSLIIGQQNMMMDVIKNGTYNNNNNNNTTNSHNKSFNLNFFLNETCKNAMNITDFINSVKIQLSDLEKVGEMGYVEGISNIIIKNLKELDVTQRPIHCTDKKREVLYVKDENKWDKDDKENTKIRKFIKRVAFKNSSMLKSFREKHPDCGKSYSKYSDQYNKLVVEAMGGNGNNDVEKENKIIKNIVKEIVIEK